MKTLSLAALSFLMLTRPVPGQDDPPRISPPNVPAPVEFRFAAVTLKGPGPERYALAEVRVKELGGRRFLVGTEVRPNDDKPNTRLPTWVAVDDVAVVKEFADATAAWEAAGGKTQTNKLSGGSAGEVMDWDGLTMKIPIDYNPTRRDEIRSLHLYVSADRGATWAQHTECGTDRSHFDFTAPKDGEYWFVMQILNKDGRKEPAGGVFTPELKVRMKAAWEPRPRMEKARD